MSTGLWTNTLNFTTDVPCVSGPQIETHRHYIGRDEGKLKVEKEHLFGFRVLRRVQRIKT